MVNITFTNAAHLTMENASFDRKKTYRHNCRWRESVSFMRPLLHDDTLSIPWHNAYALWLLIVIITFWCALVNGSASSAPVNPSALGTDGYFYLENGQIQAWGGAQRWRQGESSVLMSYRGSRWRWGLRRRGAADSGVNSIETREAPAKSERLRPGAWGIFYLLR